MVALARSESDIDAAFRISRITVPMPSTPTPLLDLFPDGQHLPFTNATAHRQVTAKTVLRHDEVRMRMNGPQPQLPRRSPGQEPNGLPVVDGTGCPGHTGAPGPAGGGSPRTHDDGPVTSRGLPVRTAGVLPSAQRPGGRAGPGSSPAAAPVPGADSLRAFADAVLGLHQVLADRFIPMCSCGLPARHCQIVKAEHDVLGIVMPFEFGPLARPLYYEV